MSHNGSIPLFMIEDSSVRVCIRDGARCGDAKDVPSLSEWRTERKGDVAIADWDALFGAVKARLRSCVESGAPISTRSDVQTRLCPADMRETVAECVDALDQLHETWRDELSRRRYLELQVLELTALIAQTQSEAMPAHNDRIPAAASFPQQGPQQSQGPYRSASVEALPRSAERRELQWTSAGSIAWLATK